MSTSSPSAPFRATSLNASRRDAELAELAGGARPDVLVVGGGITGAGVALDAASRGLSVALIEEGDLARNSSRRSRGSTCGPPPRLAPEELAHARSRAVELASLTNRTAPHLFRTLPLLTPFGAELSTADELTLLTRLRSAEAPRRRTGANALPATRRVPPAEARALVPALRREDLRGGLLGFTGQPVDEARLVVALARTAAGLGARILPRVRATALHRDGADVSDRLGDSEIRVRARSVVNATGGRAQELAEVPGARVLRDSWLLLTADAVGTTRAGVASAGGGPTGGSIEILPLGDGRLSLGPLTTESTPGEAATRPAELSDSERESLLESGSGLLGTRLSSEHVTGVHTDSRTVLRRAPRAGRGGAARAFPGHGAHISPDGVVTVAGSGPSSFRKAAEEAVDTAARTTGLRAGPSGTAALRLAGATGGDDPAQVEAPPELVANYGRDAERIVALHELDPNLAERALSGHSPTVAEVLWAVRHEGALNATDVLDRRLRVEPPPSERAAALEELDGLVARALRGVLL
ncbi:glycerol-3-phosphate dehydrogenase [Actinopolyspora biskrensis]|uniref:Glycerol-3-phosphate dehydrogenase n=1 Tax=Actinopolyspora biskrensis TaxID=1470178 RepID=A0A852Z1N1_9ACTN|nr:FAD-dependent oxidoreductase [Actinopolyspora biskrensis]NYH79185.1 glycerol-3-phosphate dehydrogenase [Actinopolyspora biskrensis]